MLPKQFETNLRKVGDPFGVFLSRDNHLYTGYFDVGIGVINFSLSILVRSSGTVVIQMYYGNTLLGEIGPMNGIGSITGSVTTVGDYTSNPGPFLTLKVDGVPLEGYSITESTFVLRAGTDFVVPDTYQKESTTRAPWMEYITSKKFRGQTTVKPELSCANDNIVTTTQQPWSPPGGGGGTVTTTRIPGTTQAPPLTTVAPTAPVPIIIPTDPPPSPPTPGDPPLTLKEASVLISGGTPSHVVEVDWSDANYNFGTYYSSPFGLRVNSGIVGMPGEAALSADAPPSVIADFRLAWFSLVFE
jgi:hypothetical protein